MRIVVLAGGTSTERDVSISSGILVASALREKGHEVVLLDVFRGYEQDICDVDALFKENYSFTDSVKVGETISDIDEVREERRDKSNRYIGENVIDICQCADITFLALHGGSGENGQVQAVLDLMGLKYTGSGYLGSALAMHKGVTKSVLIQSKVLTPAGEIFKTAEDALSWKQFPCVVKPLMSSSGHGQSYVHNDGELEQAFREAMEGSRGDVKEVIIEEFIDFDSEFTLLTVTQKNGWPTIFCPPIGHVQKAGDYRESWQPYKISDEALKQAQYMADKVTKALTGAGIWGVEFFLTKQGEVIFSELSPRPHDTGMVTLGHTTNLSEFELHFRAVMGLPIPAIHLEHAGASAVILSPKEASTPVDRSLLDYNFEEALKEDRTRIRIFGKPEAHKGRRMGVVLCYGEVGDDTTALRDKAKRLAKTVLGTDPYTKFEH